MSGKHLIRARDVNLPDPVEVQYPIFDETGNTFTGNYYTVDSFSKIRFTRSVTCVFPPCIDPLQRPISGVGAINEYESSSSSVYHGLTISAQRRGIVPRRPSASLGMTAFWYLECAVQNRG